MLEPPTKVAANSVRGTVVSEGVDSPQPGPKANAKRVKQTLVRILFIVNALLSICRVRKSSVVAFA
jgi:hypothetical protein